MVTLFWVCAALATYSYFMYPGLLLLLHAIRRNSDKGTPGITRLPTMSLIVTVHNERHRLREKIENSLAIDYPKLDVVVASDASTDGTDELVLEYESRGVRLVRAAPRLGKEHAQSCAILQSQAEIVVFSDVATHIPSDALLKLAEYFKDSKVGAVSSEDRMISDAGDVVGEGAYVRYEMTLRRLESDLGGLVGLSGSFFAARRSVCTDWDILAPSDFMTAINCARSGQHAVTAPDVLGYYRDLSDSKKEYERKVRTVVRGMTAVSRHPEVLNPFAFGLFAWQMISHKIMRWLVPWAVAGMLATSAYLCEGHAGYRWILGMQVFALAVAAVAHYLPGARRHAGIRLLYFFVQVNVAIAVALRRVLSGQQISNWQPSIR